MLYFPNLQCRICETMLKKRSRSIQKDQQMGPITLDGERQKTNTFFNVPGLFVGLTPKGVSDCDSVRSPTSPLDFKLFSNLGSSLSFPKSSHEGLGHQKYWDCHKVGLGSIVDSLDDNDYDGNLYVHEKVEVIPPSNSKTILFGSQIRSKGTLNSPNRADFNEAPKSLPKNYAIFPHARLRSSNVQKGSSDVLFEIGGDPYEKIQSFSLDSKRQSTCNAESRINQFCFENGTIERSLSFSLIKKSPNHSENNLSIGPMQFVTSDDIVGCPKPEDIKLSEDYTCVISHGTNPKTIHIFGDRILDCHPSGINIPNETASLETGIPCLESALAPHASDDFLRNCYFCKKKLEGKDIYMYRFVLDTCFQLVFYLATSLNCI